MELTRRQFALTLAAATDLRSSLFEPLSPLRVPRGVVPGRVTWARDPAAVTWDGTGSWRTDANNNQSVIDRMVSRSVCGLMNEKSDAQAGNSVFHYFNRTHDRGNAGYKAGEKIAIKANLNNTINHGTIERLNSSSQLLLSLVRQLTGPGRVPESAITIFDSSRFIPGNMYDKIHHEFPGVAFADHATSINPDWHKNAHDGFHHNKDGSAIHSAFTDDLGHMDLGEKTMLFVIDGLYGNDNVDGPPHRKWKMAPFNDAWPNSIFMSFDGVAIDSVGFDFLTLEWPDLPDIANADNYWRESALANDPPSKTFCDPERDGTRCRGLGVHEHWNNGTNKKYSCNLGEAHGIELFQV